ncbi:hypothetical protein HY485_03645 [Candidatus Woesearchaeota archaeon]|nr:hypothetical protein [Candidatus Woesearchaeota archaeon]
MNVYEFYGVMLGDGCVLYKPDKKVYTIEIVGNAEEECGYYRSIQKFLEEKTGKFARLKIRHEKRGKSLRLTFHNKKFIEFLMNKFELGERKTFSAKIPPVYLSWEKAKHILRGLFETDGSLYFSRVNGKAVYPRIEIKTSSEILAEQIVNVLVEQGFQPHIRTCSSDKTKGIYISGSKAVEKWLKEIGFSSQKNKTKYELWKKVGFYIPHSSLADRQKCLGGECWVSNTL